MKEKFYIKRTVKQLLSVGIVGIFIVLAYASIEFPDKDTTYNEETKEYTETKQFDWSRAAFITKGKQDDFGLWHGKAIGGFKASGSTFELNYYHGFKHGKQIVHHEDGETNTYCFNMGKPVSCKDSKSAYASLEDPTAFDMLGSRYPLFVEIFISIGFDTLALQGYLDTIETELYKLEFDEEEFEDAYQEVVADMEGTNYDSVYAFHNYESYFYGFYYMKMHEFRRAVVETYRSGDNNTFTAVKTVYPGYLADLNVQYITDSLFQIFCHDFDSLMAGKGALDTNDPFFSDSIDVRMFDALIELFEYEEEATSAAIQALKSIQLNEQNNRLTNLRKLAGSLKMQENIDTISPGVATYVLFSMQPYYLMGDEIRLAVKDAYDVKKGIVTTPIVTTDTIESTNAASVQLYGSVLENGGAEVTERGIAWASHYNPTINDNYQSSGADIGDFSITVTEFQPGTVYYVRAYAINSAGIAYGNVVQFTATTGTYVDDLHLDSRNLTLYPNPASSHITLNFKIEDSETIVLVITDITGRVVQRKVPDNLHLGDNLIRLNVSDLKPGMYSCCLTINNKTKIARKFLVVH